MSRFDRALGIGRSLLTYHAIPFRQRRLRALYRGFVRRGDLVFDVGAHAGSRVRAFVALGCRVVAVEPQPDFVRLLEWLFRGSPDVHVVAAALATREGRMTLAIADRTPTVSTMAPGWQDARSAEPDFAAVRWNRRIDVRTTTLDALIGEYGVPALIKIDVEGGEPDVLAGLTRPVATISFEYLVHALDGVEACVARLSALGDYRFNWSPGESSRLASPDWVDGRHLIEALRHETRQRHGDVYASLRR